MGFQKYFLNYDFDIIKEKFYGDDLSDKSVVEARYKRLFDMHVKETGKDAESFFSSPGRIEIVGNHTDHNGGKVLCAAITVDTLGAVSSRDDGIIVVKSKGYPALKVDVKNVTFNRDEFGSSEALIKGIVDYYQREGKAVGGFNAFTESNVPKGSGVSSSSAFELLIAEILNVLYNGSTLDAVFKAKASQYAESVYFGKPCGLMDQSAIALGGVNMIDFADFEKPVINKASWQFSDTDIYVIATGGDHCDLTDDYAAIPAEMKSVANALGGKILKDIKPETFYSSEKRLVGLVSGRALLRAEHYYEENVRVERAYAAVYGKNENAFFKAVNESGISSEYKLQNLFSPKSGSYAIKNALDAVSGVEGVSAKRVHGGGFAGTILVFVKKEKSDKANEKFNSLFGVENVYRLSIRDSGACKVF